MAEGCLSDPVELDVRQLLGFRDLSGLGDDAAIVEQELDAAHIKIGETPALPIRYNRGEERVVRVFIPEQTVDHD